MRATMKTQAYGTLYNMNANYSRLAKVQQQIGTGSKITRLADDPLGANVAIQMDTLIARATQYNRSINTGLSFLYSADARMETVKTSIDRARYLTIQSAQDQTGQEERAAMAVELQSLLQQLVREANAYDGSRYLFGGTQTLSEPYEIIANRYVRYTGNDQSINIQTGAGAYTAVNVTGPDAFGQLESAIASRDYNPAVNLGVGTSTALSDLNGGAGIPAGNIKVTFGAFQGGLELDLGGCNTLEDVKDYIERETLRQSRALKPGDPGYDVDMTNRYLSVEINAEGNGLLIREAAAGQGFTGGDIHIDNVGRNEVASALGIRGASLNGAIHGTDLNPALTKKTLLADLQGYDDTIYTLTNGALPGQVAIVEQPGDVNGVFHNWNIQGLTKGVNTGADGQLYAKVAVRQGSTINHVTPLPDFVATDVNLGAFATRDGGDGSLYLHAERIDDPVAGVAGRVQFTLYADAARTQAVATGIADANDTAVTLTASDGQTATLAVDLDPTFIGALQGDSAVARLDVTNPDTGAATARAPGAGVYTDVALYGLTAANTGANGTLYFETAVDTDGQMKVKIYDGPTGQRTLVAQGDVAGDGSVTLHEINGSGVTGSMRVDREAVNPPGEPLTAQYRAGLEGNDEIVLEIYRQPIDTALGADLVATATGAANGTFTLREANNSGLSGTVGINLQPIAQAGVNASITLEARFDDTFRTTVHVPAFKERDANVPGADTGNVASGWQISGLQKAVPGYNKADYAEYYAEHATTGPNGELDIALRAVMDDAFDPPVQSGWEMTVTRPAFSFTVSEGQPPRERVISIEAETVATGQLTFQPVYENGQCTGYNAVNQGRVELTGTPGHEEITGSVHLEMPAAQTDAATPLATPLATGMATAQDIVLEGDADGLWNVGPGTLTVPRGTVLGAGSRLAEGTVLPKGTVLPAGSVIPAGTVLPDGTSLAVDFTLRADMTLAKDMQLGGVATLSANVTVSEATVLGEGSRLQATDTVPVAHTRTLTAGSVLPAGTTLTAGSVLAAGTVLHGGTELAALPSGTVIDAYTVFPAGTTIPAGTVFPQYSTLPDGRVAARETVLSSDVVLTRDYVADAALTLGDGFDLPAGATLTLGADTVLAADVTLTAPQQINAPVTAASGSTLPMTLPAGTVFGAGATPPPGTPLMGDDTAMAFALEATFATVEDLLNEVNGRDIYVTARLDEKGQGIEFVSQLAGAHLVVSEGQTVVQQMGDDKEQLSQLSLSGMVAGMNTDPQGNLHAEVVYYPEDTTIYRSGGESETVKAGYYVRLYSDRNQPGIDYAHRDASTLMAEAYVAPEDYTPGMTVNFTEKNASNLSGSVRLSADFPVTDLSLTGLQPGVNADAAGQVYQEVAYYAEDTTVTLSDGTRQTIPAGYHLRLYNDPAQLGLAYEDRDPASQVAAAHVTASAYTPGMAVTFTETNGSGLSGTGTFDYAAGGTYDNSITLYPGGLRHAGSANVTVSQMDIQGLYPGSNCDYAGQLHASVTYDGGETKILLYADASRTRLVASGVVGPNGYVELQEENGSRISGRMAVDSSLATSGATSVEEFTITTGGLRHSGHAREENVFATFNDVMDAMHANDTDALHDLLGSWTRDLNQLSEARASVGSRTQSLEMLVTRYEEDVISYETVQANRIATNYADAIVEFQLAQNVYDASLKIAAQMIQMSLLDYL